MIEKIGEKEKVPRSYLNNVKIVDLGIFCFCLNFYGDFNVVTVAPPCRIKAAVKCAFFK